jgi:hypothetical protein
MLNFVMDTIPSPRLGHRSFTMRRLWAALFLLAGALTLGHPAAAQTAQDTPPSPQQIQNMIAAGQETQAIQALQNVLAAHPKSGVGWYLLAEAYDAENNEDGAASALNMAARSAPGLSFANPQKLAALQARIATSQPRTSGHTTMLVIGGLILLMAVLRFLPGRDRASRNYGYTQPAPPPGTPPYGFGYGPNAGGGGLGSSLLGGLAAGAGFAAGERIIDGMMGQRGVDPNNFPQTSPDQSRDDGLMGNPGWDGTGTPSDDDLSNTGWS